MVIARLLLFLVLLMPAPVAAASDIPGARLWVEVETGGREPYPQEMVLVRVRGLFTVPIALERLEQPDLPGFRWLRLGGDTWAATTDNGRPARAFQRTLALFAQGSGAHVIAPFTHHLTLIDPAGGRREVTLASEPVTLNVAPVPAGASGWWLPARSVTLAEDWSAPPEALPIGQSARRTVTLEADGLTDDQMPPLVLPPVGKLIAFPGPATRETVLAVSLDDATAEQRRQALRRPGRLAVVSGRDGPRARAVYTWDVRPTTDEPVTLPAIEIPWFDTQAGVMRLAALPARTVALASAEQSLEAMEAELGIADAAPAGPDPAELLLMALAASGAFVGVLVILRRRREGAGAGDGDAPAARAR